MKYVIQNIKASVDMYVRENGGDMFSFTTDLDEAMLFASTQDTVDAIKRRNVRMQEISAYRDTYAIVPVEVTRTVKRLI